MTTEIDVLEKVSIKEQVVLNNEIVLYNDDVNRIGFVCKTVLTRPPFPCTIGFRQCPQ